MVPACGLTSFRASSVVALFFGLRRKNAAIPIMTTAAKNTLFLFFDIFEGLSFRLYPIGLGYEGVGLGLEVRVLGVN